MKSTQTAHLSQPYRQIIRNVAVEMFGGCTAMSWHRARSDRSTFRHMVYAVLLLAALPLTAFAGEVFITSPTSNPISLAEAMSGKKMFTKSDDVHINGRITMGDAESGQKRTYECNSLAVGVEDVGGALYIGTLDFPVEKGITIGSRGAIHVHVNTLLQWKETLTIQENGVFLITVAPEQEIRGGSLSLSGEFELEFYGQDMLDKFTGDATGLVALTGRLETGPGAVVKIKFTGSVEDAQLPAGEFPLIVCKEFSGDLPKVERIGGQSRQQLSLKKTPHGLSLIVKY